MGWSSRSCCCCFFWCFFFCYCCFFFSSCDVFSVLDGSGGGPRADPSVAAAAQPLCCAVIVLAVVMVMVMMVMVEVIEGNNKVYGKRCMCLWCCTAEMYDEVWSCQEEKEKERRGVRERSMRCFPRALSSLSLSLPLFALRHQTSSSHDR